MTTTAQIILGILLALVAVAGIIALGILVMGFIYCKTGGEIKIEIDVTKDEDETREN